MFLYFCLPINNEIRIRKVNVKNDFQDLFFAPIENKSKGNMDYTNIYTKY